MASAGTTGVKGVRFAMFATPLNSGGPQRSTFDRGKVRQSVAEAKACQNRSGIAGGFCPDQQIGSKSGRLV